jgi:DNA-binding PadR family transcriptional regulator
MTIPAKPSSRLQKYRLTEKGRRVLADQAKT